MATPTKDYADSVLDEPTGDDLEPLAPDVFPLVLGDDLDGSTFALCAVFEARQRNQQRRMAE